MGYVNDQVHDPKLYLYISTYVPSRTVIPTQLRDERGVAEKGDIDLTLFSTFVPWSLTLLVSFELMKSQDLCRAIRRTIAIKAGIDH
jgi:hypothetical protein